jgi:syntaxin-binding protein 1
MHNSMITVYDKLRVLLIYTFAAKELPPQETLDKLWQEACETSNTEDGDSPDNIRPGLGFLGLTFGEKDDMMESRYSCSSTRKSKKSEEEYTADRFVSTIHNILQDELDNRLDSKMFKSLACTVPKKATNTQVNGTNIKGPGKIVHLERYNPKWGWKKLKGTGPGMEDWRMNGPRVIVYVLGGLSFAEIRAASTLSQLKKRDILIGKCNCFA